MKVKDYIEHLSKYDPDKYIAYGPLWQSEDVIGKAAEMGKRVTQEEADNIIDDLEGDCENGLTWYHIEAGIDNYPLSDNADYDPEELQEELYG